MSEYHQGNKQITNDSTHTRHIPRSMTPDSAPRKPTGKRKGSSTTQIFKVVACWCNVVRP